MKMGTLDFSGFDVTVTLIIKLRLFGCFGDFAKKNLYVSLVFLESLRSVPELGGHTLKDLPPPSCRKSPPPIQETQRFR